MWVFGATESALVLPSLATLSYVGIGAILSYGGYSFLSNYGLHADNLNIDFSPLLQMQSNQLDEEDESQENTVVCRENEDETPPENKTEVKITNEPKKKNYEIWQKMSPFKNKNNDEIHEMFLKKGYLEKGDDCKNGIGNYFNLKNQRSYHIDPRDAGKYSKPNHVDVCRPRGYKGYLEKKRLGYQDD